MRSHFPAKIKSNLCTCCVIPRTQVHIGVVTEQQLQAEQQAAARELERYCKEFPKSPSALQRPRLMLRGSSWIALFGSTLQDGIAGIGQTVDAALRAFDAQYSASSKPRR